MKRYRRYFLSLSFFFILLLINNIVIAQVPDPTINSDGTRGGEPDAPIDGGITLVLAAGIGYGVKKHRENRKKKTVNME